MHKSAVQTSLVVAACVASAAGVARAQSFQKILATPGTLPDGTATQIASFPQFNGEQVAFYQGGQTISVSGSPVFAPTSIYQADADAPGDFARVVDLDTGVPNRPDFKFIGFNGFQAPNLIGGGDLAFAGVATRGGQAIGGTDDLVSGYYRYRPGGPLETLADTTDPFPVATGGSDGTVAPFTGSSFVSSGEAALFAISNRNGSVSRRDLLRTLPQGGVERIVGKGDVIDFGSPLGPVNVLNLNTYGGGNDGAYSVELQVETQNGGVMTAVTFVDFNDGLGLTPLVSANDFGLGLYRGAAGGDTFAADDSGVAFVRSEFTGSPRDLVTYDLASDSLPRRRRGRTGRRRRLGRHLPQHRPQRRVRLRRRHRRPSART